MKKIFTQWMVCTTLFSQFYGTLYAQVFTTRTIGTVKTHGISMYEELTPGSVVLFKLPMGKKALILEKKDDWTKIKIAVGKTNAATGWVSSSGIDLDLVAPTAPNAPAPVVQVPTSPSSQALQPLATLTPPIDPTPSPVQSAQALSAASLAPSGTPLLSNSSVPKVNEASVKKMNVGSSQSSENSEKKQHFLNVSLQTMAYNLSVKNGGPKPSNIFSFVLPGVGLSATYENFFYSPVDNFFVGVSAMYEHGYYRYKLTLEDVSNVSFSSGSSSAMSYYGSLFLPMEYRALTGALPWLAGLRFGGDYFYFSPKDPKKTNGALNLFTKNVAINVLGGAYGRIALPWGKNVSADFGIDVSALNFVKETPQNTTGTSPKASMAYLPRLGATWQFSSNHSLGVMYSGRFQNYTFKGAGSRLANANLTDASQENRIHEVGISYVMSLK